MVCVSSVEDPGHTEVNMSLVTATHKQKIYCEKESA